MSEDIMGTTLKNITEMFCDTHDLPVPGVCKDPIYDSYYDHYIAKGATHEQAAFQAKRMSE